MPTRPANKPGAEPSRWGPIIAEWKATQAALRERLLIKPLRPLPRFVAGVDAAYTADKQRVLAVALIYDRERQETVELASAVLPVDVPYIPTFLSFREGPAVMAALGRLSHPFGAVCFDGHGYAHPRRCGLASYVGILLDLPSVGVAKSRLIGAFVEPGLARGDASPLVDKDETIGRVLRTRAGVAPVFISVGHRVDLDSATDLALACGAGYRVPEPTRRADIEVARLKRAT